MTIKRNFSNIKLTCSSDSCTTSYTDINPDATVEEMYDFINAINSLQNTSYNKILRTRIFELVQE